MRKRSLKQPLNDVVNKPKHYTQIVGIDCMDVIESIGLVEHFHLACAFKYLWRWSDKGDPVQNVKKSLFYLNRYIAFLESSAVAFKKVLDIKEHVNHPDHYNKGGYECLDLIEKLGLYKDHRVANAFKYIFRWLDKDDPLENLKKARWYLDRYVANVSKA